MMDFTYYNQDCYVEVYSGKLTKDIKLTEEMHPLVWLDVNENLFDMNRFAGEGNIAYGGAGEVLWYGGIDVR